MLRHPPLLDPLIQRRTATLGELLNRQRPQLTPTLHIPVERVSVPLESEVPGSLTVVLPPSSDPASPVTVSLDAHGREPSSAMRFTR
jgi:hypothetical protein